MMDYTIMAVTVLVGALLHRTLFTPLEPHRHMYNHSPGNCKIIPGIEYGSEGVALLEDGIVLVTSGWHVPGTPPSGPSFLARFDMKKPDEAVTRLEIVGDMDQKDFNPQGIGFWKHPDKKGVYSIGVINHNLNGERVELFTYNIKETKITHRRTILDDKFGVVINDLAMTGEDSFYVTNMFHSKNSFIFTLEWYKYLDWGSLLYYDGRATRTVGSGYSITNGITMSPDDRYVYMAEFGKQRMHILKRNQDNSVSTHEIVDLHTHPDNIYVSEVTGEVWIGTHPMHYTILDHLIDPKSPAPSQLIRLEMTPDHRVKSIQEAYSENGDRLTGASQAIRYKDAILIGSVRHKLAYCTLINLTV